MWLGLAGVCAAVLSLAGVFLYLDPQIPRAESYRNVQLETPLRVYAEGGELISEFGERRLVPIAFDDIPPAFISALLDTEDKRFYEHSGIDFISLTNDVVSLIGTLITEGELGPGASTITMQLARNVSFSLERRFLRKFKEMLLALKVEQELTKEEILELYVNVVPFGKRAYGAQAAALTYYGKPMSELTLPELAMLAGIPQRPSANNPINGPEAALRRRNLVLTRMREQGSISEAEYRDAVDAPMTARLYQRELDLPSPYPAEWVRQQGLALLDDLYTGGYEIYTTIDADLQREAIGAVRRGLVSYDKRHGYRGPEGQIEAPLLDEVNGAMPIAQVALCPVDDSSNPASNPASDLASTNDIDEPPYPEDIEQIYPPELTQAIQAVLVPMTIFGDLRPAAVVSVREENACAMTADGQSVTLNLADSGWARTYIEVDLRGPPPRAMSDIVQVGDIIRLNPDDTLGQLPEIQGALIAMEPTTGAVRAMVGGFDFYRNQYNHALQAARQPGSGFKPFVYAAALNAGVKPSDIFLDAPLVFNDANLESQYRPGNDNSRYNGPTRLREALYRSINLVSMRVLLEVGAGPVLDYVPSFGFSIRNFPRNTQLAIGGGTMAVTPLEMARAYAVLANGGYLVDPHVVTRIDDHEGTTIFTATHPAVPGSASSPPELTTTDNSAEPLSLDDLLQTDSQKETAAAPPPAISDPAPRVIDERIAFIMDSMLKDVVKRGTGRAARRLRRDDLAGKTGTTNDAADTWFNGYNPDLVTTVWVGFSNHAPLGANAYGSNTPLPIWIDFMENALAETPEHFPEQPPGIVTLKIDPTTGDPAAATQTAALFEFFLSEYAPQRLVERTTPVDEEEVNAVDLF